MLGLTDMSQSVCVYVCVCVYVDVASLVLVRYHTRSSSPTQTHLLVSRDASRTWHFDARTSHASPRLSLSCGICCKLCLLPNNSLLLALCFV